MARRGERPLSPGRPVAEAPAFGVGGACQVRGARAPPGPLRPHPSPLAALRIPEEFPNRRHPPAAAPGPTFCELAVAISQSRTRKEPLTKLNGPASLCSQYLNAALCFFLVGLLCQIPFSSKLGQDFVTQRLPSTESAWRTVGAQ